MITLPPALRGALRQLGPRQVCRYCTQPSTAGALCPPCSEALHDRRPRCQRCALPLADIAGICGECLAQPPAFARTLCADSYRPPISHWLQNFKDGRDLRDGQLLVQRLIRSLDQHYPDGAGLPDYLVPVPLHWRRALWRGFNQSAWLARQLQRHFGIPVLPALQRVRAGSDQRQLDRRERQRNLRGVYRLRPECKALLHNRHVVLVDDVVTTSATVRAISRELRRGGVAQVDIWCLARTGKRDDKH